MKRTAIAALLVLSIAAIAQADSADVSVTLNASTVVKAGDPFFVNSFVFNAGPDVARNVVLTMSTDGLPQPQFPCPNGRCVIGDIGPNQSSDSILFKQNAPVGDFTFAVSGAATSDTPDPKSESNSATRTIRVTTAPRLLAQFSITEIIANEPLEPGQPFQVQGTLFNFGYSTAHDIVATINMPDGALVKSLPANCSATATVVTCHVDSMAPGTDFLNPGATLPMTFVASPKYEGGVMSFTYSAHEAGPDFDDQGPHGAFGANLIRTFLVTTTADDGPGSLRAAIDDTNTRCVPKSPNNSQAACGIAFNIAEPSPSPWKTIRLKSPLPSLRTSGIWIDGGTQASFSGVSNTNGPSIEISGGGTVNGDGLLDEGSCVTVSGLAINGFLGNGISLGRETCDTYSPITILNNYVGTDPTGSVAIPNFRGIGSASGFDAIYKFGSNITGNVISGNLHSGLFLMGGAWGVYSNRIGLKAHNDEALPNGASGIFLSAAVLRAALVGNRIAFNREMGVAIDPASLYVQLTSNLIWGNGGQAIDDGLNGPSASVRTDTMPLESPVITSAVYDPLLGETSIRGMRGANASGVEIFASDTPGSGGSGDARRLVSGGGCVDFTQCKTNEFFVKIKTDLRGQWLAATASAVASRQPAADIYTLFRTSELSTPVQVR